jgi:hypothetical protein
MKQFINVKIPKLLYLFIALLGVFTVQSCKKEDPNSEDGRGAAMVKLINASTDAGASHLYIDDEIRVEDAISLGSASGYRGAFAGPSVVSVQSATGATVAKVDMDLQASAGYSFFLTGTSGSYNIIGLIDDKAASGAGKAKVRFVQASSALTSANLALNGTALFTAQAFKAVSAYSEVTPGTYTLTVTDASSATVLASNTLAKFDAGKNYTVYTSGLTGVTGATALAVNVTANN